MDALAVKTFRWSGDKKGRRWYRKLLGIDVLRQQRTISPVFYPTRQHPHHGKVIRRSCVVVGRYLSKQQGHTLSRVLR